MRLALLIFLISFSQWDLAHNYRLNCDSCISSALCQAINNYLAKFDPAKVSLKELAGALETRFTSLQKVSLTKSWDGKIDVQVSSVTPVYIIDLKNSDRVYVLARTSSLENSETRVVPALWINPTCLENLPAVCLNLKNAKTDTKQVTKIGVTGNSTKSKASITGLQSDYGVISKQDANLISQISAEFKEFLLTIDPEISANFLIEWLDRNQIILRYCKLAENYNCKLMVRVSNLYDHEILTPRFLARCLNLLPAELFANNSTFNSSPSTTLRSTRDERGAKSGRSVHEMCVVENILGGHKITGTSDLDNLKTKTSKSKNFTIDLRFNKQIVILND